MKTAYILRHGAFGDQAHCSHLPKILKEEGYHVSFEYNWKGAQLHKYNPFIDNHVFFEPPVEWFTLANENVRIALYQKHRELKKRYDLVINLGGSLEGELIPGEASPSYYLFKRSKSQFADICFYDQTVKWAQMPKKYYGRSGELYFPKQEHDHVIDWYKKYEGKFLVIWALAGSMQQKAIYPWAKQIIDEFHSKHPDSIFCITAGKEHNDKAWENEYTVNLVGKLPFRQIALMTRYANAVVTPETGLGIIAGSFGTPKIMLLTAASIKNIVGNDKNDFSLQSHAWCSPCQRAIYNTDYCECKDGHPICVNFNKDLVVRRIEEIYHSGIVPERIKRNDAVYM
jgi:ADP-heptose:LPS heptosyltransferase